MDLLTGILNSGLLSVVSKHESKQQKSDSELSLLSLTQEDLTLEVKGCP